VSPSGTSKAGLPRAGPTSHSYDFIPTQDQSVKKIKQHMMFDRISYVRSPVLQQLMQSKTTCIRNNLNCSAEQLCDLEHPY
jgi:hypothetical protein